MKLQIYFDTAYQTTPGLELVDHSYSNLFRILRKKIMSSALHIRSIRSFIGANNFSESRKFYQTLGFEEVVIDAKMSLFRVSEQMGFYLQNAYVKDWIENSMLFLEVADVEAWEQQLLSLNLTNLFPTVKMTEIRTFPYGREIFLHDPAGVLWHFCQFHPDV